MSRAEGFKPGNRTPVRRVQAGRGPARKAAVTGDEPAGGTIDLSKQPVPERPGPAWIVVPARVIALIVVLPLRLVHDLLVAIGRGVRAGWLRLMRAQGRLARFIGRMLRAAGLAVHRWLLAPLGRLIAAVGRGIGALLNLLVLRPLRWLAVVVILGLLRLFGRGAGWVGRWLYRALLVPIGRMLEFVLLRPLRALGRGLAWLLSASWRGIVLLIGVLVVVPAVLVWRYVLRPPLLALAWLGRGGLTVLAAFIGALAAGLVWSWRLLGRVFGWLGRVLFVIPARALWRYVLAPVAAGVAGAWRLASRVLRWLWRTLVVVPVRVVIVAPARWVRASVLRPLRDLWRVSVREPLAAARRTMRQASRDVRLTLRRAFRGR